MTRSIRGRLALSGLLLALAPVVATPLPAQVSPGQVITIARGTSSLVASSARIERVSIGDPEIADAVAVTPFEVLVNARKLGSTSLIVWETSGARRLYTVEVTVDAAALERQLRTLFPGEQIGVSASGNLLILSGRVSDPGVAGRALSIARGTGATVIENLNVPPPRQILLRVRFAEVSRRAALEFGTSFRAGETAARLNALTPTQGDRVVETLSDGLVRLFLFDSNIQFSAVIQALQERGVFRSLAEPNLLAVEGTEASFLAGGEFPYPVPQGGQSDIITVLFKEFGVRLRFTPTVTIAGNIRLKVAPEVSSLDFANGVQLSGFQVPTLLTRRTETEVELRPGQTFAISGLIDNSIQSNSSRIPFLGDVPILGALFRSRDMAQRRTELLVLVTPHLVEPSEQQPALPTGEPGTWDWMRSMRSAPVTVPPIGDRRQ